MGNDQSKNQELTQNGTIPEKHENGSVNGLSANITSNGLDIDVKDETSVQQNGGPLSLNLATESTEPDFVIVDTSSQLNMAPVISEVIEPATQSSPRAEVKKSKEEKGLRFGKLFKKKAEPPAVQSVTEKENSDAPPVDVSLPATDPEPESGSSGEEAAATFIAEHREVFEYLPRKAEISTQTDQKTEADVSTQTDAEGPVEEAVAMETAEEDSWSAEEAVEGMEDEEPLDDQAAGLIAEDVVIMENNVDENTVFRAEWVEITESVTEGEIAEETGPLEISSRLPKVVSDCVEAIFSAEPNVDEVTTEDSRDGAADVVLSETAEPESNAVTPEAEEANGVPSLDEEPVTTAVETTSEVVPEEPNPEPANQVSVPLVTEILVKVESAHEEVSSDDDVAVEDASGISELEKLGPVTDGEPSEECDSCPEEERNIVEALSNQLVTIEELPEDILNLQEPIPDVIAADEKAELGEEVIADMAPETVEEAEPSPIIVRDEAEVIPEAAIDALSQDFKFSAITPQRAAVDYGFPLEEEEIISKAIFVPLYGDRKASFTIPEEPSDAAAEEMNEEEAIEALAKETEAVPDSVVKVTTVQEVPGVATSEKERTEVDVLAQAETPDQIPVISEEPVEENPSPREVLENILEYIIEAFSGDLEVSEDTVEEPADEPQLDVTGESEVCVPVQEELLEENVAAAEVLLEDDGLLERQLKTDVLVFILETTEDEMTEEVTDETEHCGDVLAAAEESVEECVNAVLETIVEEIIAEDVAAGWNLVTSDEEEIISEEEAEERAEDETSVTSTDSTLDSQSADMEALLIRLQSVCTSVVEESAYRLGDLMMSSQGYRITVTIHVSAEEEQQ